jgi:hypothetical protein
MTICIIGKLEFLVLYRLLKLVINLWLLISKTEGPRFESGEASAQNRSLQDDAAHEAQATIVEQASQVALLEREPHDLGRNKQRQVHSTQCDRAQIVHTSAYRRGHSTAWLSIKSSIYIKKNTHLNHPFANLFGVNIVVSFLFLFVFLLLCNLSLTQEKTNETLHLLIFVLKMIRCVKVCATLFFVCDSTSCRSSYYLFKVTLSEVIFKLKLG